MSPSEVAVVDRGVEEADGAGVLQLDDSEPASLEVVLCTASRSSRSRSRCPNLFVDSLIFSMLELTLFPIVFW